MNYQIILLNIIWILNFATLKVGKVNFIFKNNWFMLCGTFMFFFKFDIFLCNATAFFRLHLFLCVFCYLCFFFHICFRACHFMISIITIFIFYFSYRQQYYW